MPVVPSWPEPLARAYATCERLARSHYENFPVASRLLPKRLRPHIAAVYAFARGADDIADEGGASAAGRQEQLQAWRDRLHDAARADRSEDADRDEDWVFVALGHTIRSLDLPVSLFDDLLSAFGQDTMTTRYASWRDLLDYCRRSANPVGRLVLRIAGYRDDRLDRSSDALCTALQLTNFEFLAGLRARLARRPALRAARRDDRRRRARRAARRSAAAAGVDARDRCLHRLHGGPLRRGAPSCG
jgi:phytoene/squalene synthetase